ncbi:MAG: Nicotinamidase, partial [uncultured Nocardioidaceae bacterium]
LRHRDRPLRARHEHRRGPRRLPRPGPRRPVRRRGARDDTARAEGDDGRGRHDRV